MLPTLFPLPGSQRVSQYSFLLGSASFAAATLCSTRASGAITRAPKFSALIVGLVLVCLARSEAVPVHSVRIILPPKAGSLAEHASEILTRQITNRCDARIAVDGKVKLHIKFG